MAVSTTTKVSRSITPLFSSDADGGDTVNARSRQRQRQRQPSKKSFRSSKKKKGSSSTTSSASSSWRSTGWAPLAYPSSALYQYKYEEQQQQQQQQLQQQQQKRDQDSLSSSSSSASSEEKAIVNYNRHGHDYRHWKLNPYFPLHRDVLLAAIRELLILDGSISTSIDPLSLEVKLGLGDAHATSTTSTTTSTTTKDTTSTTTKDTNTAKCGAGAGKLRGGSCNRPKKNGKRKRKRAINNSTTCAVISSNSSSSPMTDKAKAAASTEQSQSQSHNNTNTNTVQVHTHIPFVEHLRRRVNAATTAAAAAATTSITSTTSNEQPKSKKAKITSGIDIDQIITNDFTITPNNNSNNNNRDRDLKFNDTFHDIVQNIKFRIKDGSTCSGAESETKTNTKSKTKDPLSLSAEVLANAILKQCQCIWDLESPERGNGNVIDDHDNDDELENNDNDNENPHSPNVNVPNIIRLAQGIGKDHVKPKPTATMHNDSDGGGGGDGGGDDHPSYDGNDSNDSNDGNDDNGKVINKDIVAVAKNNISVVPRRPRKVSDVDDITQSKSTATSMSMLFPFPFSRVSPHLAVIASHQNNFDFDSMKRFMGIGGTITTYNQGHDHNHDRDYDHDHDHHHDATMLVLEQKNNLPHLLDVSIMVESHLRRIAYQITDQLATHFDAKPLREFLGYKSSALKKDRILHLMSDFLFDVSHAMFAWDQTEADLFGTDGNCPENIINIHNNNNIISNRNPNTTPSSALDDKSSTMRDKKLCDALFNPRALRKIGGFGPSSTLYHAVSIKRQRLRGKGQSWRDLAKSSLGKKMFRHHLNEHTRLQVGQVRRGQRIRKSRSAFYPAFTFPANDKAKPRSRSSSFASLDESEPKFAAAEGVYFDNAVTVMEVENSPLPDLLSITVSRQDTSKSWGILLAKEGSMCVVMRVPDVATETNSAAFCHMDRLQKGDLVVSVRNERNEMVQTPTGWHTQSQESISPEWFSEVVGLFKSSCTLFVTVRRVCVSSTY